MSARIAVINAGSSSLKFAVFDVTTGEPALALRGQFDALGDRPTFSALRGSGEPLPAITVENEARHAQAIAALLPWLDTHAGPLAAIGHRVVHGGEHFTQPIRIDSRALASLRALIALAPLHQPHNVAAIEALMNAAPGVPQVACFDTAFHATLPRVAREYALPRALTAQGIRRYGFHGLSYESIAAQLPSLLGATARARVIVAHLGNGASLCAMRDLQSVATTMGLTPLEGLVMGTRCGSIDPGVLLHLMREANLHEHALSELLYFDSGLKGVSGVSHDMRTLLASDAPDARFAVELFCYRLAGEIAALACALGGLEALVFTGGIGEHAAPVRADVCERLEWLGVRLNAAANASHVPRISTTDADVSVWVVPTDEERVIAHHTARIALDQTRSSDC